MTKWVEYNATYMFRYYLFNMLELNLVSINLIWNDILYLFCLLVLTFDKRKNM